MKEEGRVARRQRRNRDALIAAARDIMTEKGVDAATMLEIADRADVGAGTVYSYFRSKDELAIAVLEALMHDLAVRIEAVTNTFTDPAQVYAFGVRTVLDTAIGDVRWAQMLNRSEVIADAMFRVMGPFAIRDLRLASQAGRFAVTDAELVWRISTHAIIGAGLAITTGKLPAAAADEIVVRLLCMTGIGQEAAAELARAAPPRPCARTAGRDLAPRSRRDEDSPASQSCRPAQARSSATAMPWPTPMHMVESERRPPPSASSSAAVPVMRAPDMPSGWPSAMAPPLGFTRGSSSAMPSCAQRGEALGGEGLVQLDHVEIGRRQAEPGHQLLRWPGAGPMPMMRGGDAGRGPAQDAGDGRQPVAPRRRLGGEDQRRRAVIDAARHCPP